jgi:hypothetical protein
LRVGVELEVTVDGEAPADAYRRPYRYSPRVAVDVLLASDGRAAQPDREQALRLGGRRPKAVGHTLHHYLAVVDAQSRNVRPRIAQWDRAFVNVVVSAWHPDVVRNQVLLIGENEGGGTPEGDKGRINAIRFRPRRPRARRLRTAEAHASRIPLVKGRRNLVYSLPLDELRAREQLWFEAELVTRSALRSPARISTEIFLAERPNVTEGPGETVASICEFHGQVAKFNGFNCLPGEQARTRKVGVMRIRREPGTRLYANLVATCSDPLHPARRGETLAVVGGYLQAQRYRPEWTG